MLLIPYQFVCLSAIGIPISFPYGANQVCRHDNVNLCRNSLKLWHGATFDQLQSIGDGDSHCAADSCFFYHTFRVTDSSITCNSFLIHFKAPLGSMLKHPAEFPPRVVESVLRFGRGTVRNGLPNGGHIIVPLAANVARGIQRLVPRERRLTPFVVHVMIHDLRHVALG